MISRIQDIVDKLLKDGTAEEVKRLQREIIKVGGNKPGGKKLIVDGLYGEVTENAINSVSQEPLLRGAITALGPNYQFKYNRSGELVEKGPSKGLRNVIMDYLASVEGEYIHKNSTEDYITAPYGIYKKAFPTAEIFTLIDRIAKKNGLDPEKDLVKLNNLIDDQYRDEFKNVAWSFYVKEFLDPKIMSVLGDKSGLSVFSNSVNAGKQTGILSLQYALGVKQDGIVGAITLGAMNKLAKDDDALNKRILDYMNDYYHRLVENNPSKYYSYLDGWINRLRGLGYNS